MSNSPQFTKAQIDDLYIDEVLRGGDAKAIASVAEHYHATTGELIAARIKAGADVGELAKAATRTGICSPAASAEVQTAKSARSPVLVRLADVEPEAVQWLWPGRIAIGKVTLLAGDPGLGKSFVSLDMAARVSTGRPWPDAPQNEITVGGAVLLNAEDDVADTIRPRLDTAGADVSRILALEAVRHYDAESGEMPSLPFCLTSDLPMLAQAIREVGDCRLVVIDPITAYLGGTDSHKNADIRAVLAPLATLASEHEVAILAVTHLNKNAGGPVIYRAMGSLAFTAAARAVWAVTKDKDDPRRRLVLPVKNNLACDVAGLAYRIASTGENGAPAIDWEDDPVEITADDALSIDRPSDGGSAMDEAVNWLRDVLADGPVAATDVKQAATRDGVASRTLDRAKARAEVVAEREGFAKDGRWVWRLPH